MSAWTKFEHGAGRSRLQQAEVSIAAAARRREQNRNGDHFPVRYLSINPRRPIVKIRGGTGRVRPRCRDEIPRSRVSKEKRWPRARIGRARSGWRWFRSRFRCSRPPKAPRGSRFNQIHKPTGKRIRYEKVVPGIGAVDPDEIVKGYEVEKGKYVLLTDEEIDEVKLEAKHTIDLVQFVDEDEIDPVYFEKPYYRDPDETRSPAKPMSCCATRSRRPKQDRPRPARRARPGEHRGAQAFGQGPRDRDAALCG